jgi:hypothetical protein
MAPADIGGAAGQAKAQETISKTLTPDYLRFKLYDNPGAKMVLLPDKLTVPVLINPEPGRPGSLPQGDHGTGDGQGKN